MSIGLVKLPIQCKDVEVLYNPDNDCVILRPKESYQLKLTPKDSEVDLSNVILQLKIDAVFNRKTIQEITEWFGDE